jgi:uncharacterized protein (DUF2236 family)
VAGRPATSWPMAYPDTSPFASLTRPLKSAIAGQVVAIFNDKSKGEKPVPRQTDGLFGPQSVAWKVHGDVVSMMTGGVTALLLQMLHPAVLAGVWDHSQFRGDMRGRLRRTARFIALTTYGGREEAQAAIARVRHIHSFINGTLPDGTPYEANDPSLLAWVHLTEAWSFLAAYQRYTRRLPLAVQNRYFAEMAQVARALGADPVPETLREAETLMAQMRPAMRVDDRVREICRLVLTQPASRPMAEPLQRLAMGAAIDLLPDWAKRLHALPPTPKGLVRAGTFTMAQTLRWAFT